MSTNAARITEISVADSYSEFDAKTGEIFSASEGTSIAKNDSARLKDQSQDTKHHSESPSLNDRFQNTLDSRATELLNSVPGIETLTALVAIDPEDLSRGARVD
jgi:predicted heme/steroid binding protein